MTVYPTYARRYAASLQNRRIRPVSLILPHGWGCHRQRHFHSHEVEYELDVSLCLSTLGDSVDGKWAVLFTCAAGGTAWLIWHDHLGPSASSSSNSTPAPWTCARTYRYITETLLHGSFRKTPLSHTPSFLMVICSCRSTTLASCSLCCRTPGREQILLLQSMKRQMGQIQEQCCHMFAVERQLCSEDQLAGRIRSNEHTEPLDRFLFDHLVTRHRLWSKLRQIYCHVVCIFYGADRSCNISTSNIGNPANGKNSNNRFLIDSLWPYVGDAILPASLTETSISSCDMITDRIRGRKKEESGKKVKNE